MAVFSSLKYAFVASCALSLMQVAEALPTSSNEEWITAPHNILKRQNAIAFSGVQQGFGPLQGQVPLRKEIRQLINNPTEFNLFILALQRFYQQPQTSDTSYYGIAGIHGRPYKAWNNVFGAPGSNTNTGYCTHSDVLFPSWHRPYLALYEQIIWEHARNIVNEFPENRRAPYAAALPGLRIPYWDWASNAVMPPQVGEWVQITVDTPRGQQTIPNPLYSYRFTDLREIPDQPFNRMQETVRFPAQLSNGQYQSQPAAVNQALQRLSGNMRNRVYQLLTAYKQYNVLASKASSQSGSGQFDSLEGVHDTIHGTVGSGGHMGWVDVAAFDPIFWLHHTNIDRLFAIWQGINPSAFQISGRSSMGTYAIRPGTTEDLNTPLPPFRQSANTYYTSATAARTKTFGYAYPETIDWTPNTPAQGQIANVIAAVNGLYGRGTPAMSLQEAGGIAMKKRSAGELLKRADAKPNKVLNLTPSPESLATVESEIVEASTYNEWLTDINVNNAALNGTFSVHVFLGEFSTDPEQWAMDKNLVGTHSVFTAIDGGHDSMVSGTVPLTSALLNKVIVGELDNLKPETVVPYLKKALRCRVATAEGAATDVMEVEGLKVQVAAAPVVLPASQTELPQWGEYQVKYDVVDQARNVNGNN